MSKLKDTLLWSCQRSKEEPRHYLFGTLHVRAVVAHRFLQHLRSFMQEVDRLAIEYDLETSAPSSLSVFERVPGFDLKAQMGPQPFEKNRKIIMKATGVDLEHFRFMHPVFTQSFIDSSFFPKEQALALDQELWNKAQSLGLECFGLETINDQIRYLQSISIAEAVQQMNQFCRSVSRYRRQASHMLRWYQEQRTELIYQKARRGLGKQRKLFLFQRNQLMIERFVQLSESGRLMAAVGAGHLGGGKGMLALLKKKGWKVEGVRM